MDFPLTLYDLGIWLGLNSVILFLTSFVMLFVNRTFMIKRNNLKKIGLIVFVAFVLVAVLQTYDLLMRIIRGEQDWILQLW